MFIDSHDLLLPYVFELLNSIKSSALHFSLATNKLIHNYHKKGDGKNKISNQVTQHVNLKRSTR